MHLALVLATVARRLIDFRLRIFGMFSTVSKATGKSKKEVPNSPKPVS